MRRILTVAIVCLLVAGSAYLGFAAEKEKAPVAKGENVTITGQFSCTFCKLAGNMTCTPECCMACTKAGDPPLLTDAEGNMYLLLTNKMAESLMTPERVKMLQSQVTVKGLLVKGKGIQAIYVDSMVKAEAKKAEEKK